MNRTTGGRQESVNKFTARRSKYLEKYAHQLGNEWPSPVCKTHKHSSLNTEEASDRCKFLGQRCYCMPVVNAWVYSASLATITSPSNNIHINGWGDGQVHVLIATHATGILINEIRNRCMGRSLVLAALHDDHSCGSICMGY